MCETSHRTPTWYSGAARRAAIATTAVIAASAVMQLAGCSPSAPSPRDALFTVDVAGERLTMRLTDPDSIRLAEGNLRGRNTRFPLGPLRKGDGGFNARWSWHLDPAETRLVEVAIELCDGRPSYVEEHQDDYPVYCPWGARVIERRR